MSSKKKKRQKKLVSNKKGEDSQKRASTVFGEIITVAVAEKLLIENTWVKKENEFLLDMEKQVEKAIELRQHGSLTAAEKKDLFSTSDLTILTESFYMGKEKEESSINTSEEPTNLSQELFVSVKMEITDYEGRNNLLKDGLESLKKQLVELEEKDDLSDSDIEEL